MSAAASTKPVIPAIYSLRIQRFRGITELTWQPGTGVNVLLGGGDVGKTTILEAIALLLSPVNPSNLSDPDYHDRDIDAGFCIEAVLSVPPGSGISNQFKPSWPWQWTVANGLTIPCLDDEGHMTGEPVYHVRVRGTEDLELAYDLVQPDGTTDSFSAALCRTIGLVRLSGDDRNDRDLRLVQGSALDRLLSDKGLRSRMASELAKSNVRDQLTADAQTALTALDAAFRNESLPSGLDLAITGGQGASIASMIGLTANRNGVQLPLASWGAGTRRLSALTIAEENQGEAPITLVDEVERGLEPYRQRSLIEKLQDGTSQVFLTTHSPAAIAAASKAALWYVDHAGHIGPLDATKIARHRKADPETFLSRLAIVAEGATEVGFTVALLERALGTSLEQYGIYVSDGVGHDATIDILEALAAGGLRFGGFADDEGRHPERWRKLHAKLGALLFRWPSLCIDENIVAVVPPAARPHHRSGPRQDRHALAHVTGTARHRRQGFCDPEGRCRRRSQGSDPRSGVGQGPSREGERAAPLQVSGPDLVQDAGGRPGVGGQSLRARPMAALEAAAPALLRRGPRGRRSANDYRCAAVSDEAVRAALRSEASLVVVEAPAGCGKTHQGADYARELTGARPDRLLILTHTHAACSVFASRTRSAGTRVEIRTLHSLTAHIATAYHQGLGLPADIATWARRNTDGYAYVAQKVAHLLDRHPMVAAALAKRYPTVICDEHQDCSGDQHAIGMALMRQGARLRVFMDPLQRIYKEARLPGSNTACDWAAMTGQADAYQTRSGSFERWMVVPAVTEVCRPQSRHSKSRRGSSTGRRPGMLDIFVPQDRQRDVLAPQLAVDASPIRLGVAAMALLGSGVLVQLRFEIAVGDGLRQRPVKTGGFETRDRLAHRRRRQPRAPRDLVLGNPGKPETQNLAHAAHSNSPCWHRSAPQPKPKKRTLRTASRGSCYSSPPGDIIPEWWARIDRNAGRQLIGIGGRHHSGIRGRLAPESAPDAEDCSRFHLYAPSPAARTRSSASMRVHNSEIIVLSICASPQRSESS
jgi:putative ATP-dependent endonuclease of the OLD family